MAESARRDGLLRPAGAMVMTADANTLRVPSESPVPRAPGEGPQAPQAAKPARRARSPRSASSQAAPCVTPVWTFLRPAFIAELCTSDHWTAPGMGVEFFSPSGPPCGAAFRGQVQIRAVPRAPPLATPSPFLHRPIRMIRFNPAELHRQPPSGDDTAPALRLPGDQGLLILAEGDDDPSIAAWSTWLPENVAAAGAPPAAANARPRRQRPDAYQLYALVSPTPDSPPEPSPQRPLRLALLGWELWRDARNDAARAPAAKRAPAMPPWMETLVTHLTLASTSLRGSVVAGLPAGARYPHPQPPRAPASIPPEQVPVPAAPELPAANRGQPFVIHPGPLAPPALALAERLVSAACAGSGDAVVSSAVYRPPPNPSTPLRVRVPVGPVLAADDALAARYAAALMARLGPHVVAVITPADLDRVLGADALLSLLGPAERLPPLVLAAIRRPHVARSAAASLMLLSLLAARPARQLATLMEQAVRPSVSRIVLRLPLYHLRGDALLRAVLLAWLDQRNPRAGHKRTGGADPQHAQRSAQHLLVYRPFAGAETVMRTLALTLATWVSPAEDPLALLPVSLVPLAAFHNAQEVTEQTLAQLAMPAPCLGGPPGPPGPPHEGVLGLVGKVQLGSLPVAPRPGSLVETLWRDSALLLNEPAAKAFFDRLLPRLALFDSPHHITHWLGIHAVRRAEAAEDARVRLLASEIALEEEGFPASEARPASSPASEARAAAGPAGAPASDPRAAMQARRHADEADVDGPLRIVRKLRRAALRAGDKADAAARALRMWILPEDDDAEGPPGEARETRPARAVDALLQRHPTSWRKALADLVALPVPTHCHGCLDDEARVAGCNLACGHRICLRCLCHNPKVQCAHCRRRVRRFLCAPTGHEAQESDAAEPRTGDVIRPRTRRTAAAQVASEPAAAQVDAGAAAASSGAGAAAAPFQASVAALMEAIQSAGPAPVPPPLVAPTAATEADVRIEAMHALRPRLLQWVRQMVGTAASASASGASAPPTVRHHRFIAIVTQHAGDPMHQPVQLPRKLCRAHAASLTILHIRLPFVPPVPTAEDMPFNLARHVKMTDALVESELRLNGAGAAAVAAEPDSTHVVLVHPALPHALLLALRLGRRADVGHIHLLTRPGSMHAEHLTDWVRGGGSLPHPTWSETPASAQAESALHFSTTILADEIGDAEFEASQDTLRAQLEGGEDSDDDDDEASGAEESAEEVHAQDSEDEDDDDDDDEDSEEEDEEADEDDAAEGDEEADEDDQDEDDEEDEADEDEDDEEAEEA